LLELTRVSESLEYGFVVEHKNEIVVRTFSRKRPHSSTYYQLGQQLLVRIRASDYVASTPSAPRGTDEQGTGIEPQGRFRIKVH
jgi:hypothetical protein